MTIKYTKQEVLAGEIGALVGQAGTINKQIDEKCQALRSLLKGKKLGTVRDGDVRMLRFKESQEKLGLAEQTVKNNLSTFRKAVNEGKAYDVNAKRNASKGAKQKGSVVPDVKIILSGDPDEETIAKKFREILNGWKKKDKNVVLASFILDGLDEFEGK